MTTYQLITQAIGLLATVIVVSSFQIKSPRGTFVLMSFSFICFTAHYFMLGSLAGALQNFLSLVRNICILAFPKDSRAGRISKIAVLAAISSIPFVELLVPALPFSPWDFLVVPATAIGSAIFWTSDAKKIRIAQFCILSPAWLTYNIVFGSIPGIATECFNLASVALSSVRMKRDEKKKLKELSDPTDNSRK